MRRATEFSTDWSGASRPTEKNSNTNSTIQERLSSGQSEEVKEDDSPGPHQQSSSQPDVEKDSEFRQNVRVLDSEKQSRENFFHFIGNLFNFSAKASPGNGKQPPSRPDPCEEHEDSQVINSLQEQTQDDPTSDTEHTGEFSPVPFTDGDMENPTETLTEARRQEDPDTTTLRPKLNNCPDEAPAVTYGTYRGSRRIRKLLKRRADVNSPIPEKEETSEKEISSTGDGDTENCHTLQERLNIEPVSYRSSESEVSPKLFIKMKMQPKTKVPFQNIDFTSCEVENLRKTTETSTPISNSLEANLVEGSDISFHVMPKTEEILNIPKQLNAEVNTNISLNNDEALKISVPSQTSVEMSLEDLEQNNDVSLTSSEHLKINFEKTFDISLDRLTPIEDISIISVTLQEDSKKGSNMEDLEPNSLQQNFEECSPVSGDLRSKTEERSGENIQTNVEEACKVPELSPPNTDEISRNKSELKTGFEEGPDTTHTSFMDLQVLPLKNAETVNTSENINLNSKDISEIQENQQRSVESASGTAFDPCAKTIKTTCVAQSRQEDEDLHINTDSTKASSKPPMTLKQKLKKAEEFSKRKVDTVSPVSESTDIPNRFLMSDKASTIERTCNAREHLDSPQNLANHFIQLNEVDHWETTESLPLNFQENGKLPEEPPPILAESTKTRQDLQICGTLHSNITTCLQQNADESSKCKEDVPFNASIESHQQIRETPPVKQQLFTNGDLTMREGWKPNGPNNTIISEMSLVNAPLSTKAELEPKAEGGPKIAEQEHPTSLIMSNFSAVLLEEFDPISETAPKTAEQQETGKKVMPNIFEVLQSENSKPKANETPKPTEDKQPNRQVISDVTEILQSEEPDAKVEEIPKAIEQSPNKEVVANISEALEKVPQPKVDKTLKRTEETQVISHAPQALQVEKEEITKNPEQQTSTEVIANLAIDLQPEEPQAEAKEPSKTAEVEQSSGQAISDISEVLQPEDSETKAVEMHNYAGPHQPNRLLITSISKDHQPEESRAKKEEITKTSEQDTNSKVIANFTDDQQKEEPQAKAKETSKTREDKQPTGQVIFNISEVLDPKPKAQEMHKSAGSQQPIREVIPSISEDLQPEESQVKTEESPKTTDYEQPNREVLTNISDVLQPVESQLQTEVIPQTTEQQQPNGEVIANSSVYIQPREPQTESKEIPKTSEQQSYREVTINVPEVLKPKECERKARKISGTAEQPHSHKEISNILDIPLLQESEPNAEEISEMTELNQPSREEISFISDILQEDTEGILRENIAPKGDIPTYISNLNLCTCTLPITSNVAAHTESETEEQESPKVSDLANNSSVDESKVNVVASSGTINEFKLLSPPTDSISKTIEMNGNAHEDIISGNQPVSELCLRKCSSLDKTQVTETVRTVSFDNGIECRSPSPAVSGTPSSPADGIDLRCDSPLPLSDAIDSGMVSSQAYTPEEHMPVKISEIDSQIISDSFAIVQEAEETSHTENVDSTFPPVIISKELARLINAPLKDEGERKKGENIFPRIQRVSLVDSCEKNVDDVSGRFSVHDRMKTNLNSDVFVTKVSVKSVNVEEVKLSPFGICSDIISVSKTESPHFEKELIHLPTTSPPPTVSELDDIFKDRQPGPENADGTINTPSDKRKKDVTVNNVSFQEPGPLPDIRNYEDSDHGSYMEVERVLSLNKKNEAIADVINIFPNDFISNNIQQYPFIQKGLPTISEKSPDELIENLKNNNLTMDTRDDFINISVPANTTENDLPSGSLLSSDSPCKLRSCDSEFHSMEYVINKEPRNSSNVILHSTLQNDVYFVDDIDSSGSTTPRAIHSTEQSDLSNETFEEKANEIIFSVLHSAIDELHSLNKNHINAPSLATVKEKLIENNLLQPLDGLSTKDDKGLSETPTKNRQSLSNDPAVAVATATVKEVIGSQEFIKNGMDINIDRNNVTGIHEVKEDETVENVRHSNQKHSLLNTGHPVDLSSYEVNSNEMLPRYKPWSNTLEQTSNVVNESLDSSNLESTNDMEESLSYFNHSPIEGTNSEVNRQVDNFYNSEDEIQGDVGNTNVRFHLEDLSDCSSKSLETEGSMEEAIIISSADEGENMRTSGPEYLDPFQFLLYSSKYVEIVSDDELGEDDPNAQDNASDLFLTVPSRRVKVYPLSLSPIYEDDSACEDVVSSEGSPMCKEGAAASSSASDHTSILSLLQSVSDRLKEANLKASGIEAAAFSDQDNKDTSGRQGDIITSAKSNLDAQKRTEDEKTSGGKRSGLFITKTENRPNPTSGRQSLLLNLTSQSFTNSSKTPPDTNSTPSVLSESSPSPTSESTSSSNKDLTPSGASFNSPSPLQMLTDSGWSILKPDIEAKSRLSSKSVYYQYFHSSQNSLLGEEKESPTQEKVELLTEKESREAEYSITNQEDSESLKFNPRPGKVILSDIIHHEEKIELSGDALDGTSWEFPNGVNIRVIRGCWILYEKPHFEGQAHVLEEGEAVLLHLWDRPGDGAKPHKIRIGSVKRVAKDYLPEVVISSLQDTEDSPIYIRTEVPSLENLVDKRPRSLTVNSGVWLAYSEPQYSGTVSVLEEGCSLPQIQECGVKSTRPLKMGGLKVQIPNDPKIILYEKPHLEGRWREIAEHVPGVGGLLCDGEDEPHLQVGSLRVVGGIWVGYEKERYKGHQYLLEEGEYEDWQAWGGYSSDLQSIRYLQANFLEACVTLFETDFEDGKHIDFFNQAIPDLELAGYSTRTQCIHVKKGMWVAYQQKHYCGEQYILEKGRYKTYLDWGGRSNTIMSIRPVLLEPLGRSEVKHAIKAYEQVNFQGESLDLTQRVSEFPSFMPKSFKVLRGCWLLCYQADSGDNVCVLEEGHFPDLASCGCPTAEIKYIQPIDYVFAEPSISLFALDSCEGRELHFEESVTSVLSEDLHFYTQSVWVRRGLWIAFEGSNFLGRQMLLDPQQILNWSQFSGWKAIGSLRPLKQPAVYFMVRNRHKDKYLTVSGKTSDTRATFVTVSPRNGQSTQIWYFSRGFLKSKANDSCLDVIGGKNIPGSKVSLWTEHGKVRQKWKIDQDGTITSYICDDLVLDIKGGTYYDQNYLVVNRLQEGSATQKWDIEIL
ncbi:very large A-kinase anchor protein isoform X2 [Hyperolius riggenbachi]|uniref:very large A-kinase anchor protein isoform X2 n=1 Tax=Hyperolius riggenbachi TaxID=752182 RepID=UPI0035A376F1